MLYFVNLRMAGAIQLVAGRLGTAKLLLHVKPGAKLSQIVDFSDSAISLQVFIHVL